MPTPTQIFRRANNLCYRCGKEKGPSRRGSVLCEVCTPIVNAKQRAAAKRLRERRAGIANGTIKANCPMCGRML
jgi:hypothetical protein